jgi:hypothetical protein
VAKKMQFAACPFCDNGVDVSLAVKCEDCGALGPDVLVEPVGEVMAAMMAQDAWNTRRPPEKIPAKRRKTS